MSLGGQIILAVKPLKTLIDDVPVWEIEKNILSHSIIYDTLMEEWWLEARNRSFPAMKCNDKYVSGRDFWVGGAAHVAMR